MLIEFRLTIPNVGSWNGRWSGESNYYAQIHTLPKTAAEKLIDKSYFHDFGDGWSASIRTRQVDSKEAQKIRKKSKGFCGYEWMIKSILLYDKIQTDKEIT